MKFFHKAKDGGPDSNVTGYWLIEWKEGFSIALLCFTRGSREAFHSHAFNAWSWILNRKGLLREVVLLWHGYGQTTTRTVYYGRGYGWPIVTQRDCMHKVHGVADKTWALTIRGPWAKEWKEVFIEQDKTVTLTHGRQIVNEQKGIQ